MEKTLTQRIDRAEGAIECEKLQSMHSYMLAGSIHREELLYYWSDRFDITFAHSYGQNGNSESFWYNYVLAFESKGFHEYINAAKRYPEIREHMDNYLKAWLCSMHALPTPIIEVSGDGKSAKANFYTMATLSCLLSSDGEPWGTYSYERYGCDFVYENGLWYYLNMRICSDLIGDIDEYNWPLVKDLSLVFPDSSFMELDVPGPLHFGYSVSQLPQQSPGVPVPYESFEDTFSYADVKTLEY